MTNSQLEAPKYRPDIDGLRAISILSVVLFHAFPNWIGGGFVGVDVFFVISGYLISFVIIENLKKNTFSFLEFYCRRIKRIFPALIIVLLFCYIFGWRVLFLDEYCQLAKHIMSSAGFIQNIILWKEASYFDNAAELKPLLHIWSLGIEEQFYLFWPLVLFISMKRKLNLFLVIFIILLFSLLCNLILVNSNSVLTFYSPLTRFWELLSGNFIAWFDIYKRKSFFAVLIKLDELVKRFFYNFEVTLIRGLFLNVISIFGLLLLLSAFYFIDKTKSFPGFWALLPVLGAVLLIFAGPAAIINNKILSNKIAVWFGLISFPLYLWHWTFLSFALILHGGNPLSLKARVIIVIFSTLFAWITYKFLEIPIRKHAYEKTKVLVLFTSMSLIALLAYNVFHEGGLSNRHSVKSYQTQASELEWVGNSNYECREIFSNEPQFCLQYGPKDNIKVAIIGDSTANSLAPGLGTKLAAMGIGVINLGDVGSPPVRGLVRDKASKWGTEYSVENTRHIYDYIFRSKSIDTVVLAMFISNINLWGIPNLPLDATIEQRFNIFKVMLDNDIQALVKAGKKVILTYDTPLLPVDARACIKHPISFGNSQVCEIRAGQFIDREPNLDLFDHYYKNRKDVCIVDQSKVLIRGNRLHFLDDSGHFLLRDHHHLSVNGSNQVAEEFVKSGCLGPVFVKKL